MKKEIILKTLVEWFFEDVLVLSKVFLYWGFFLMGVFIICVFVCFTLLNALLILGVI